MAAFGSFVLVALCALVTVFVQGITLSKGYLWFLQNTYNLPSISMYHALGLTILIRIITHQNTYTPKDEEPKSPFIVLAGDMLKNLAALGFMYIFHVLS